MNENCVGTVCCEEPDVQLGDDDDEDDYIPDIYDNLSGQKLEPKLVAEARKEELTVFRDRAVYEKRSIK